MKLILRLKILELEQFESLSNGPDLTKMFINIDCKISANREILKIEPFQNFGILDLEENFNFGSFRNFHGSISSLPGLVRRFWQFRYMMP